ncbi:helix-turn-helix domain-containing protein [Microbulbifer sp. 2201CG32-9]|uniref:helix-turn-helix domain-containing protein n=1 Tax=Microbulbifer sp. 2201CG32-9 TaxID=3232309 RepID=UPI00345B8FDA
MSDKRAFEGVWIPAELWLSKDLSLQEKVMLVEINSLSVDPVRGCYKSNKAFAEFFNLSPSRVSEIISSLEKKGYLTITQKRDGKRICERNIFVSEGYSESRRRYSESRRGYSENAENPIRNPEGGYSENAEESSTDKSNTVRVIQRNAKNHAPAKPKKSSLDFASWPEAPSASVLSDWQATRKAKLTQTAVNRMAIELRKAAAAGYSVDDCLSVCCERGWRSFRLEWLKNHEQRSDHAKHQSSSGQPNKLERIRQQCAANFAAAEAAEAAERDVGTNDAAVWPQMGVSGG